MSRDIRRVSTQGFLRIYDLLHQKTKGFGEKIRIFNANIWKTVERYFILFWKRRDII